MVNGRSVLTGVNSIAHALHPLQVLSPIAAMADVPDHRSGKRRMGSLATLLEGDFGFEQYVDLALSMPMMLVRRCALLFRSESMLTRQDCGWSEVSRLDVHASLNVLGQLSPDLVQSPRVYYYGCRPASVSEAFGLPVRYELLDSEAGDAAN